MFTFETYTPSYVSCSETPNDTALAEVIIFIEMKQLPQKDHFLKVCRSETFGAKQKTHPQGRRGCERAVMFVF